MDLNSDATVICSDTSSGNKTLILPNLDESVFGRMIYVKNMPLSNAVNSVFFSPTPIPFGNLTFSNEVLQILASSNTGQPAKWLTINQYGGCNVFSTSMAVSSLLPAASLPFNATNFFVNTLGGPKAVLLPPTTGWEDRMITIKNTDGAASSNPIFISTPTGVKIDNFTSSIPIHHDYGSIDLYAGTGLYANQWIILNYYDGQI
jgi:hypothetical protein